MNCNFGSMTFTGNIKFPSRSYKFTSTGVTMSFAHSSNFNGSVHFPNGLRNCRNAFYNCVSLNRPVRLPDSLEDCYGMFQACRVFDQPVHIPNKVINCYNMFTSCSNLNSRVTFADDAIMNDATYMLYGASSFNQPIEFPNSVKELYRTMAYTYAFNQPVNIPTSAQRVSNMFERSGINAPVRFLWRHFRPFKRAS